MHAETAIPPYQTSPRRVAALPRLVLTVATCLLLSPLSAHFGTGIAADNLGGVYFVDPANRILYLDSHGELTEFATDLPEMEAERLRLPHHLALDSSGKLYCVGDTGGVVWRFSAEEKWERYFPAKSVNAPKDADGDATIGFGGNPFTIGPDGSVYYVAPAINPTQIRRVFLDGREQLVAGGTTGGFRDGTGEQARFGSGGFGSLHDAGFAWGADGTLYLTDGNRIRSVDQANAVGKGPFSYQFELEFLPS